MAVQGVLRSVLRPGIQGAARRSVRRVAGGVPRHVPELGLPDPAADLRRVPDRPAGTGAGPACWFAPPGEWSSLLMCRHVAYIGPPVPLRSVLIDPPLGLYRQSWTPRMQLHGTVNADGFGVGWYAGGDPVPARYRRAVPIWGDQSLPDLARVTRSAAVLAAVRSATPGTVLGESAVAPFASGPWLFSHNGVLNNWPSWAEHAAAAMPSSPFSDMEAMVDSAFLWAL